MLPGGPGRDGLFGGAGDAFIEARDGEQDDLECASGNDVASVISATASLAAARSFIRADAGAVTSRNFPKRPRMSCRTTRHTVWG